MRHVAFISSCFLVSCCFWFVLYTCSLCFVFICFAALIKLVDEVLFSLDNNHVCGMVLVDYRKAFDMVDHKLLLRKLELYGMANWELVWCHSYLLERKQVVRVDASESREALMLYGVP